MFHLVKSWGSLVSCHRANIGFDSDRMPNFRSRKLKPRTSLFFSVVLSYCRTTKRQKTYCLQISTILHIFMSWKLFIFDTELLCGRKIVELNELHKSLPGFEWLKQIIQNME